MRDRLNSGIFSCRKESSRLPRSETAARSFIDSTGRSGAPALRKAGVERGSGRAFAPVAELHTAECTVVERTSQQFQNTPEGVPADGIDPVFRGEAGEVACAAAGTFHVTAEKRKKG